MSGTFELEYVDADALEALKNGNPDFVVLASYREHDYTAYVVSLPQAATHFGLLGKFYRGSLRMSYKSTKFGWDLYQRLTVRDGVEVWLTANPHTVTICFDSMVNDPEPLLAHQLRGFPAWAAVAVQASIKANRGPLQRLAEYVRRI